MFGGQALSCKCHLIDDTALLFLTVPKGMLCKKMPCLINKLTLFAFKFDLQTSLSCCICIEWRAFAA